MTWAILKYLPDNRIGFNRLKVWRHKLIQPFIKKQKNHKKPLNTKPRHKTNQKENHSPPPKLQPRNKQTTSSNNKPEREWKRRGLERWSGGSAWASPCTTRSNRAVFARCLLGVLLKLPRTAFAQSHGLPVAWRLLLTGPAPRPGGSWSLCVRTRSGSEHVLLSRSPLGKPQHGPFPTCLLWG